jgi:hypothetical protein
MSHEYELARTDPGTLAIELLVDTPAVSPRRKAPAAGATPAAPAAEARAAEAPASPVAGSDAQEGGQDD